MMFRVSNSTTESRAEHLERVYHKLKLVTGLENADDMIDYRLLDRLTLPAQPCHLLSSAMSHRAMADVT